MKIIDNNDVKSTGEIQKLKEQLINALADKARLSEALNTMKAASLLSERKPTMALRRSRPLRKR